MNKERGKLVVVEGIDGSGKGTVVNKLKKHYEGKDVLFLREPGGTPIAEQIRKILLDDTVDGVDEMSILTEKLLFYSARSHLVSHVIRPALERGTNVVMDRCDPSTFAYQVRGNENHELEELFYQLAGNVWGIKPNKLKRGTPIYDLVICLDLPVRVAQARVQMLRSGDRIEQRKIAYHSRVRRGYAELAKKELLGRWHVIDARQEPDVVCQQAIEAVKEVFGF